MPSPTPPKPNISNIQDEQAIIAWGGDYPTGTTFNVYWEAGALDTPPGGPLSNTFETGLTSRQSSIRAGTGAPPIPANTNVYVAITSVFGGVESSQGTALFLSLKNAAQPSRAVGVGMDDVSVRKYLHTDECGNLGITSLSGSAPIPVDEAELIAQTPTTVPVSTTPVALPASPVAGRRLLVVQNQGSTDLYVGLSGSEIFKIERDQTWTITLSESSAIFGVRLVGSGDVIVWEFT